MENFAINSPAFWLCLTTLVYFLMNGAQIFETLVFVPKWTGSPPNHFQLLLDGCGTSLKTFWIVFHSIHEVIFILAIVFCWGIPGVRNWLLVLFGLHMAVRVWTVVYFAAKIIQFQKVAEEAVVVDDLEAKTRSWQALNYLRVGIFIGISLGMIPLCILVMEYIAKH